MRKINFFDVITSHGSFAIKFVKLMDYFIGTLIVFFLPTQKSSVVDSKKIKNILIIRPGGIGDAVFLLPILKILKTQGYGLTILCESRNREVFASQGYQVFLYHQLQDLRKVLGHSYDAIVDTEQWHYLSGVIGYFIKSHYKIGFVTRPLRGKLFNVPVEYDQDAYELDNFLRLFEKFSSLKEMTIRINGSFDIPQDLQSWASQRIPKKSISVSLGGSIGLRRFTKEQLMDVLTQSLKNDEHVVLLGGADVQSTTDQFLKRFNDSRILNFVGKTSLMQSAALIQRSQKFIGPDSGITHLANALGTPVTAVFGPGHVKKWAPKEGDGFKVVSKHLPCSPCTQFGYTNPTCQNSYLCVKDLIIK